MSVPNSLVTLNRRGNTSGEQRNLMVSKAGTDGNKAVVYDNQKQSQSHLTRTGLQVQVRCMINVKFWNNPIPRFTKPNWEHKGITWVIKFIGQSL